MAKLVAIGDSLVQGAQSLAVSDVRFSFPAMVAKCMGLSNEEFVVPNFTGAGGLPFNLEWLARNLEREYGGDINFFEWFAAAFSIGAMLDKTEDYWERGKGARPVQERLYHNLAVFGFQVNDSYSITPAICNAKIGRDKDEWLQPPSHGWLRIARRLLNPAATQDRMHDTQLSVAKKIADRDGGIENLIVCLGSNNCLNTLFNLSVVETGPTSPGSDSHYTLWSASAFREEYEKLADGIDGIGAQNVFVANVPRVTMMPLTRGVMSGGGPLPANEKYYDYYGRVWIDGRRFDPRSDKHITGDDARKIDDRVDEYNRIIAQLAGERGWHVIDLCQITEEVAWYRNHGSPVFQLPDEIADLDARFFKIDENGQRQQGGIFSLDGMHPTTCGYGVFAQAFVDAIRSTGQEIDNVDFSRLRRFDTLVSNPPRTLDDGYGMLEFLETNFHFSRWIRISIDDGISIG